ncbi:MAG TPA: CpaF family protein [Acidobacteriota bacterium]|nr:CpaF family protein [Acidobacteriota bacterium]
MNPSTDTFQNESLQADYSRVKNDLHAKILDQIDLERLERLDEGTARDQIRGVVRRIMIEERTPLSRTEREKVSEDILHEFFGLGPLEPILADQEISDILVNGSGQIFIEKRGRLQKVDSRFDNDEHLMRIITRIVSRVGRRIDESSPMVDARLADGSRVNAIIPPLALDGPALSIRRFGQTPLQSEDLLRNKTLTQQMLDLMRSCVAAKLNVLISGGTGAGKTTLLNVVSGYIPEGERIVTIEDAAELQLHQSHVVRLETRPPNIEGKGAVRQRELVINALRMRPDRIIVGEVRGAEAVDMLQAMNTGHEGSLTTIHANSPRDALSRLETMVSMANLNIPDRVIRQQIASALDLVIQVARLTDGTRRIVSISEITGMEGQVVTMQEIFAFKRQGIDEEGNVLGRFGATGIRPKFTERLDQAGVSLPKEMFLSGLAGAKEKWR